MILANLQSLQQDSSRLLDEKLCGEKLHSMMTLAVRYLGFSGIFFKGCNLASGGKMIKN